MIIPAISLWQPWASLIAAGVKPDVGSTGGSRMNKMASKRRENRVKKPFSRVVQFPGRARVATRSDQETKQFPDGRVEITSNGITIWVNAIDEGCVGRFGVQGVDVHRTLTDQIAGKGECLACTHQPTTFDDWRRFKALMREHYGIEVPDRHMPIRFKGAAHE